MSKITSVLYVNVQGFVSLLGLTKVNRCIKVTHIIYNINTPQSLVSQVSGVSTCLPSFHWCAQSLESPNFLPQALDAPLASRFCTGLTQLLEFSPQSLVSTSLPQSQFLAVSRVSTSLPPVSTKFLPVSRDWWRLQRDQ